MTSSKSLMLNGPQKIGGHDSPFLWVLGKRRAVAPEELPAPDGGLVSPSLYQRRRCDRSLSARGLSVQAFVRSFSLPCVDVLGVAHRCLPSTSSVPDVCRCWGRTEAQVSQMLWERDGKQMRTNRMNVYCMLVAYRPVVSYTTHNPTRPL